MAFQLPELGLLSLAMMVALLSGGLDLSIIATANLSALAVATVPGRPRPIPAASAARHEVAAVLAGLGCRSRSARSTASSSATSGLADPDDPRHHDADQGPQRSASRTAASCRASRSRIVFLGNGSLLGVPMPLILFVAVALPLGLVLNRTPFGVSHGA